MSWTALLIGLLSFAVCFALTRWFLRRNKVRSPADQAPGFPLMVPPPERNERRFAREARQSLYSSDTAEARKLAGLRTIRPRLSKGQSGEWWCMSRHLGPDRTRPTQFMRVGHGATPREAYDSWINY